MVDFSEFRTAKMTFGDDNITFVVEASIDESWESLTFPIYLDQPMARTLPTVKRIIAHVKRRYQPESPLHSALDGNPMTLVFEQNGETHQYNQAQVLEWRISGKLGEEMIEHVALSCEEAV